MNGGRLTDDSHMACKVEDLGRHFSQKVKVSELAELV
jgi:hypothetical protein